MRRQFELICWLLLTVVMVSACVPKASDEFASILADSQQQQQEARELNSKIFDKHLDISRKRELLEEALKKDDSFGEAHNNLGVVLFEQERFYEAAIHFKRAADVLAGSSAPLVNLALLHAELGQWDRALPYARQAYDRDPHHLGSIEILARCKVENRASKEELKDILERLVMMESSPFWRKWALEKLSMYADE